MKVKKIKSRVPLITLISAIGVLTLGVLFILLDDLLVETMVVAGVVFLLFTYGILRAVECSTVKKHLEGVLSLLFCWISGSVLLMLDYSNKIAALVPSVVVGIVSLLLGIVRLMISINCFINHYKGAVHNLISSLLCLGFGVMLTFWPIENFALLSNVVGFYLIFFSVTMFGDVIASIFRLDLGENRTRRRTHRALPNIITAVKPSQMITYINQHIAAGNVTSGVLIEEKADTQFTSPNLEIMVHLTTQGANKFGHVDIAIGDTVYTYGTYDSSTVKFMGFVAQGCFVTVPKIPYLKYCLDYQKKYVVGFGAQLSEIQLDSVRKKISEMMEWCVPLESEYEKAVRENRDGSEYSDPASNIVRDLGGKVYTVEQGPFRRYFGINTNCVHVADWLLSESGIDAISFSSLCTPGAYYTMLNNMFLRKNTRVIRKTAYIYAADITEASSGAALPEEAGEKTEADNTEA